MLYHFIAPLSEYVSFLRLFQYITFRSMYAAITALVLVLLLGNMAIKRLRALKFKEEIYALGPQTHKTKAGTPTMGGVVILGAVLVSILFWGNFKNHYLVILICAMILLGILGFIDDYMKSVLKRKNGMPAKMKFTLQIIIAVVVSVLIYFFPSSEQYSTKLFVPFFNRPVADLALFWIVFSTFVIVASTNAVNLTDGLDGLAIGSIMIAAVSIAIMTYLTGNIKIANYLRIPYVPAGAELTVFVSAIIGAAIGFLWFNSNPASVFMGDTGSLALGGVIGIIAVMIKKEIFLFIVGGVWVMETISVIIQVMYFKFTRKRIFKMAPLHHHFELEGWPEQKVVVRMWILGIIFMILGLSSLKIL
ncbi:MAG: phospho-N-acetylmuramoyl-pentapeptide-transferase [Spirochaetes bacterium]|nr:phospho-N-acetylmuramoyl-pentapeptide-transferase [Spirochaetota bacterium]